MIEHRRGDIFEQRDLHCIVHQCNLYHTFGNGIAKAIKSKYPWAYEADKNHGAKGDRTRLGTYEIVHWVKMLGGVSSIVNAYCQDGLSSTNRTTNYAAMGKILFSLERELAADCYPGDNQTVVGIPHGIGCGLANGSWSVVGELIHAAFENSPIRAVICRL